jgi:hypothetical protein
VAVNHGRLANSSSESPGALDISGAARPTFATGGSGSKVDVVFKGTAPMSFLRSVGSLVALSLALSVTARAEPAEAIPIGIRHGNTEYKVSCDKEIDCDATASKMCPNGYGVPTRIPPLSFHFVCKWEQPAKQTAIQVFIIPECKELFYGPDFVDLDLNGKPIKTKRRPKPDHVAWDPANAVPMSYMDARTMITIHVDSDGRHLTATDGQGRLLWARNPWDENHLCPYRTPRPVVIALTNIELSDLGRSKLQSSGANPEHSFLRLTFDSSQYGALDESTGDFFLQGQS